MTMDIIRFYTILEKSLFDEDNKAELLNCAKSIACVNCAQALWQEVMDGSSTEFIVVCEKIGKISATITETKKTFPSNCYFIDPKKEEEITADQIKEPVEISHVYHK